jgi:hypothetical protein
MVDERTATWRLAEDLKNWQELGGFETAIQNAKNQLDLLNMTMRTKKTAIATLVHLQKTGMTEEEIIKLCMLVGRWNTNGVGLGIGRDNGIKPNSVSLVSHLNLPNQQHGKKVDLYPSAFAIMST